MSMTMIHTELHTVHDAGEAEALAEAGLPHITNEESCASCAAPVGCVEGKFIPAVIVLNDEHDWVLCMRCAAPTLWPRN
jgi:hypothetical protein